MGETESKTYVTKFERRLAEGYVLNKIDDEYRANVAKMKRELEQAQYETRRLEKKLLDAQAKIVALKRERNRHWAHTYPALKRKWIEFGRRHG
jgi:multidrug resistance efflux pump